MTREETRLALDQFRSSILVPLGKLVEKMGLGEHPGVTNPWMVKSPPLTEDQADLLMEWHRAYAHWRVLFMQHYEATHTFQEEEEEE
jgi:hypothetical protein